MMNEHFRLQCDRHYEHLFYQPGGKTLFLSVLPDAHSLSFSISQSASRLPQSQSQSQTHPLRSSSRKN